MWWRVPVICILGMDRRAFEINQSNSKVQISQNYYGVKHCIKKNNKVDKRMENEQKESKVSSSPGSSSVATARAKCPLEKSTQGCTRLVPQSPGLLFSGLGGGVGVGGVRTRSLRQSEI